MIRPVTTDSLRTDAAAVAAIYAHYVRESVASFELQPPAEEEMAKRMDAVLEQGLPWLVQDEDGRITGYAFATPWKPRRAYAHTVETSVYVSPDHLGRGIGKRLLADLITRLEHLDVHCALAGIAQPNHASVALHERLGFSHAGTLREVGWKFDQWTDVGYWQYLFSGPADS